MADITQLNLTTIEKMRVSVLNEENRYYTSDCRAILEMLPVLIKEVEYLRSLEHTNDKFIYNAHVKEFETVYNKNDLRDIKWIKIVLQVVAAPGEHHHVTEFLAEHMEKSVPRYLKLAEQ